MFLIAFIFMLKFASLFQIKRYLYVASIAAELLDNDEDGVIDDFNVKNELIYN